MSDQEPPDPPKVPSAAGLQQKDPDQLKDELEQLLRAYIARQNKLLHAFFARQNGIAEDEDPELGRNEKPNFQISASPRRNP